MAGGEVVSRALIVLFVLIFWSFLLIGTVYLVGWKDWSGWWFLLTLALMSSVSVKGDD